MTNPFTALGLEERYDLPPQAVERAYLSRIAALHPDLAGDDDDQERAAAELNDAKRTLLDGERRAEALLALRGGPAKPDDKTLPPGFLMDILQVREEMESDLAADPVSGRAKWKGWAEARRRDFAAELAAIFAQRPDAANLKAARVVLNQWRYVERMLEQLSGANPV